jgi:D-aminopeptidase
METTTHKIKVIAAVLLAMLSAPAISAPEGGNGTRKQLFVLVDMEGASEITETESEITTNGTKPWREKGRNIITSDVKAVCDAANDFGIDEIVIYDMHFAGNPEPNIKIGALPANVRLTDTPDRCMDMRRIRGQVQTDPFGMVFVGQHARAGTPNAYFPHSIQGQWKELRINGLSIAETGYTAFNFPDVKLLAVVGDAAAMGEAEELYPRVVKIPVKDKAGHWAPGREETYKIIRKEVLAALQHRDAAQSLLDTVLKRAPDAFDLSLTLQGGYRFEIPPTMPWKGKFTAEKAEWQAPSAEIGLELLWYVNAYARKGKDVK